MKRPFLLSGLSFLALIAGAFVALERPAPAQAPAMASDSQRFLDLAKKRMERGQDLFMQGKFAEAIVEFQAAYQAQPFAAFLYNEAVCQQKVGNDTKALDLFRRYLAADPKASDAERTRARIRKLEEKLASAVPVDLDAGDAGDAPGDADADAISDGPVARDAGPAVTDDQVDQMKSLVVVESEPSNAPVSIYFRKTSNAPPFVVGQANSGWDKVFEGKSPISATMAVGRYHIVMERFADFHQSETDIDVAAGRIHQFKANLRQGEFLAFLRVTSPVTGARVYVDDPPPHKKPPWGRSPHEGLIGLGEHTIWVERSGYETVARTFSVVHGEQREELVELAHQKMGKLRIDGNAAEIIVQIDGQAAGTYVSGQPLDLELSSGPHKIVAKSEGRKKLDSTVDVAGGQILPVDLVMMPKTPRGAAWTQGILSAAFLGGGLALGAQSNRIYDNLNQDRRAGILAADDERYNSGKLYAIGATGCYSVGGVLAILSAYNFIKDPTPESAVKPGRAVDLPDGDEDSEKATSSGRVTYVPLREPPDSQVTRVPLQDITLVPMQGQGNAGLILQGRF